MENDWRNEPGEFRRVIGTHGDSSSLILSDLMRLKASPTETFEEYVFTTNIFTLQNHVFT